MEDFKTSSITEYQCPAKFGEAVQFDFATNIKQNKIWGVSAYDASQFTISYWRIANQD